MTVYKIQVICKRLDFILEGACALDELEVRGLPRAPAAVSALALLMNLEMQRASENAHAATSATVSK